MNHAWRQSKVGLICPKVSFAWNHYFLLMPQFACKGEKVIRRILSPLFSLSVFAFVLLTARGAQALSLSSLIEFPVQETTIPGTSIPLNVYYHIPDNPKGVIYFFHGAGGGANKWFLKVESPLLLQEAVDRGFGVISMESDNRVTKEWAEGDPKSHYDTVDTENVWKVYSSGLYDVSSVPTFAVGFSNGGGFTGRMAFRASDGVATDPNVNNVVPFQAVAVYGFRTRLAWDSRYDIPTIYNVGINDNQVPAYPADDSRMAGSVYLYENPGYPDEDSIEYYYNILAARGIGTEMNVKFEEPLQPDRFARIPGLDVTDSNNIYQALKDADLLDANDYLLFNPTDNWWKAAIPSDYAGFESKITQQLVVVYGEHTVMSDFNSNTLNFFESHLPASSVPEPSTYLLLGTSLAGLAWTRRRTTTARRRP